MVVVILLNRVVVVFFTWKGYGVEGGEGVSGLCCCCCCCSSVCLFVFACLLACLRERGCKVNYQTQVLSLENVSPILQQT